MIDINDFTGKECIYILMVDDDEKLYKFGRTGNIITRMNQHRRTFDAMEIVNIFEVSSYPCAKAVEQCIKNYVKQTEAHCYYDPINNKIGPDKIKGCETEMFITDDIDDIVTKIRKYIDEKSEPDEVKIKLLTELEVKKRETFQIELEKDTQKQITYQIGLETFQKELEVIQAKIELEKLLKFNSEQKVQNKMNSRKTPKTTIKPSNQYAKVCTIPKSDDHDSVVFSESEEGELKCSLCSKFYSSVSNLNRHTKTCNGPKPDDSTVICKYCSKTYVNKHSRIRHESTCSHKPVECPKCTKVISNKSNLTRHMKKCEGAKPDNHDSIVCEYCFGEYYNKYNRIKHEKNCSYKPITDTKCKHCLKIYATKDICMEHELSCPKTELDQGKIDSLVN